MKTVKVGVCKASNDPGFDIIVPDNSTSYKFDSKNMETVGSKKVSRVLCYDKSGMYIGWWSRAQSKFIPA